MRAFVRVVPGRLEHDDDVRVEGREPIRSARIEVVVRDIGRHDPQPTILSAISRFRVSCGPAADEGQRDDDHHAERREDHSPGSRESGHVIHSGCVSKAYRGSLPRN